MRKWVLFLLTGIFIISFVFAQTQIQTNNQIRANIETSNQKQSQEENSRQDPGLRNEIKNQMQVNQQIRAGDYIGEMGERIKIHKRTNNRLRLEVNGVGVDCDCNLTEERIQNKTRLKIRLSNGINAEIKVMPETASETALQRLRLKVCSEENNCSIELKEVGKNNQTRLAYEVQAQRHYKLLGLFRLKARARAQVDAETGETIMVKRPWWAFLASEPEE